MKKIITLLILLSAFIISCGKKVKVDKSKCLNPAELNQMLNEYYSKIGGGPYPNPISLDENYDMLIKIHSTIGCEINSGKIREKFEAFEEYKKEEKNEDNLTMNDKASYPLSVLKLYKYELEHKTFKTNEVSANNIYKRQEIIREAENIDPNKLEAEMIKTYDEITPLMTKENVKDSKLGISPYSDVAHILQGEVTWTY